MDGAADPRWFAVYTQQNLEERALQHLLRQGFEAYLPRYRRQRRHARRTTIVARPLFPRYLFVRLDLATQQWRPIRSTVGVIDLVSFGEQPAHLPSEFIEQLRAREDSDGCVRIERAIDAGESVQVLSGPFMDNFGVFEAPSDHQRVQILLNLLGRQVRVVLAAEAVAKRE